MLSIERGMTLATKKKSKRINWQLEYTMLEEKFDILKRERDTLLSNNYKLTEFCNGLRSQVEYFKKERNLADTMKHLKECEGLG